MAKKPVDVTPQIAKRAYELYERRAASEEMMYQAMTKPIAQARAGG